MPKEEPVSPNGVRRIFRALCNMAICDGEIDVAEQKVLDAYCIRYAIAEDEAKALQAEGISNHKLKVGRNPVERRMLLNNMIEVAAANGVIDPAERRRLLRFGEAFGLTAAEIDERVADWLKYS